MTAVNSHIQPLGAEWIEEFNTHESAFANFLEMRAKMLEPVSNRP